MAKKRLRKINSFSLSHFTEERIEALAEALNMTKSGVVELAIKKVYLQAKKKGLIEDETFDTEKL